MRLKIIYFAGFIILIIVFLIMVIPKFLNLSRAKEVEMKVVDTMIKKYAIIDGRYIDGRYFEAFIVCYNDFLKINDITGEGKRLSIML